MIQVPNEEAMVLGSVMLLVAYHRDYGAKVYRSKSKPRYPLSSTL